MYVLENDDEAAETNVTKTRVTTKPDGVAIETMPNEEATETSATFAGGTDAALFFDFTDGLGDDVSDADSQDSNREDAPDADYPDTEDSFSEDEDEDAWGRERHADRNVGGYGFWPGFDARGALAGGDATPITTLTRETAARGTPPTLERQPPTLSTTTRARPTTTSFSLRIIDFLANAHRLRTWASSRPAS